MKKPNDNKLLWSLALALGMTVLVILIFTTAKMTPAVSNQSGKPFYEIPKGKSAELLYSAEDSIKMRSRVGFIDPIVTGRIQEERDGVPGPLDIMYSPGILPGINDGAFPKVHAPEIPGYGTAPKSPYKVLYDPDSPFEFTGQPGRLGEKMKRYMNPDDKRKSELGLTGEPYVGENESENTNVDDLVPRSDKNKADIKKFGNTMMKIFFSVMNSRKSITPKPNEPVEGNLEEDTSDSH